MKTGSLSFLLLTVLLIYSCISQRSTPPDQQIPEQTKLSGAEFENLDSFDISFRIRGHCYAYSSAKYQVASNGEAHSDNIAMQIDKSFHQQGLFLEINEKEIVRIDSNYLGCKLYFVNSSNEPVSFEAQDSRLNIIAEAKNKNGNWVPISYLPSSWCGNSYHTVTLGANEYWSFDIPIFKGKIKTKLRYTLIDKNRRISSNEITAYLNKGQFNPKRKQGHTPSDIMDPYND